jgi:hypothetical protein
MKFKDWPLLDLSVSLLVLMSMFAVIKLLINKLPDSGIIGDIKHFFMLA